MNKKLILLSVCGLLAVFLWSYTLVWSQRLSPSQLEEKLEEAEKSYFEKNYAKAEDIFISLSESFPADSRFSYFQLMIAKCEYHLKDLSSAEKKFRNFIHQFPQSSFIPACYFMLGNIAYLQGNTSESAQNFIYAYQKARTKQLKLLIRRSLEPLLEKWLSPKELKELARENKDRKVAPLIFFWLGKRSFESGNYVEAINTLTYYRDNFPRGEEIKEVSLLLEDASRSLHKPHQVGVLVPLSGEFSSYGNSLLNGIKLALASYPSAQAKIKLKVKDTRGDFVRAAQLCRELIEKDTVACVIGPLRSVCVVGAAMVAECFNTPLITPTASKKGLASLGDFVFQLSPSPQTKGESLAEFVLHNLKLSEFVMLVPEEKQTRSEALSFKRTVEKLGGQIMAIKYYPPDVRDFSPYFMEIKSKLLGYPLSSISQEEDSFFDEIPVWIDGIFISANQNKIYDILSRIVNLNLFATIIVTGGCGSEQILEFARNLGREIIFSSDMLAQDNNLQRRHLFELYSQEFGEKPDLVSMQGYECMELLLSIFENATSSKRIREALIETTDFKGEWGKVRFNPQGENIYIPIYKLTNEQLIKVN